MVALVLLKINVVQNKGYGVKFISMMSPTKFYRATRLIL